MENPYFKPNSELVLKSMDLDDVVNSKMQQKMFEQEQQAMAQQQQEMMMAQAQGLQAPQGLVPTQGRLV